MNFFIRKSSNLPYIQDQTKLNVSQKKHKLSNSPKDSSLNQISSSTCKSPYVNDNNCGSKSCKNIRVSPLLHVFDGNHKTFGIDQNIEQIPSKNQIRKINDNDDICQNFEFSETLSLNHGINLQKNRKIFIITLLYSTYYS